MLASLALFAVRAGQITANGVTPAETEVWRPTGETQCSAGKIQERWCFYECAGISCTPIYCEWRATSQSC